MVRSRKRQYHKSSGRGEISSSCNNNIIKDNSLGFYNETLDFEPDDLEVNTSGLISSGHINMNPCDSSYTSEMISLNSMKFPDGKQKEYIPALIANTNITMIDSISESSSVSSSKDSHWSNNDISDLNEEHGSLYGISAEDENKLLESSEDDYIEEEDNEQISFNNDFFKNKVVMGENNRIIITSLCHAQHENVRTIENEKVRATCPRRKKKKWDLSFNPSHSPIHLYLQDIGYSSQSDDEAIDSSASSSCSERHTITSFKISCSDEERVCQQIEKVSSPSISLDDMNFKLPLPPVKRPPTRPKRQGSFNSNGDESSISSTKYKQLNDFTMNIEDYSYSGSSTQTMKEDDSISIIASTLGTLDNLENEREDWDSSSEWTPKYLSEREPYVRNWVKNVPSQPFFGWKEQEQKTDESASSAVSPSRQYPPVDPNGKFRLHFKDVPSFFSGLCYYKFINGKCAREGSCQKAHKVERNKFQMRANKLTSSELINVYQFSLCQDELYEGMHICLVKSFGHHRMQSELVACIKDFFRFQGIIDVSQAVEETVRSLESTGLTFLETIDKISLNVGFMQFPLLADILLELVTRKKSNVSENWEMIKRICKAKEKIPADIARRILVSSISGSYNRQLCLDVYDVIIKNNATDLTLIEDKILVPFRTLISFKASSNLRSRNKLYTDDNCAASTITNSTLTRDTDHFVLSDDHFLNRNKMQRDALDIQTDCRRPTFERSSTQTSVTTSPVHTTNFVDGKIMTRVENTPPSSDCDTFDYVPQQYIHLRARKNFDNILQSEELSEAVTDDLEDRQMLPPTWNDYTNDEKNISGCAYTESDFHEQIDIFPSQPIMGNRCYNKHYIRDISLHNLLCNPLDSVDIHESDVKNLNFAIKKSRGDIFLQLLYKYNQKETITNFITMTLAHLKSCYQTSETFDALLESCAKSEPNFSKIKAVKGVLEVVVLNILFEYEKRGLWKEASLLVQRFCDWDSLVSSKIFGSKQLTDMGKYLYLAKTLIRGENFYLAYNILQCPNLRILDSMEKWPYFCHIHNDLELRNNILTDLLNCGFKYDMTTVLDMYRNIFANGGIKHYDIHDSFNRILITVIDEQRILALKNILKHIEIFYKEMDKVLLRAFIIVVEPQIIMQEKKFRLYEFCCLRNIYTRYKGDETNIVIRTNMLDVEIRFILLYFFNKLSSRSEPPSDCILIDFKLQDFEFHYPKILTNTTRSIKQVNDAVRTILSECFELPVYNIETSTRCVISAQALTNWWQSINISI